MSKANGTPDALGEEGRVQIVVAKVKALQGEMFELDLVQAANGHKPHDKAPTAVGADKTYDERRSELHSGIENIAHEFPDLWPLVRGFLMGVAE